MTEGTIISAKSGFYYVYAERQLITCRARGKFRYEKMTPLVGDRVKIERLESHDGVIDEILPRKNEFSRPAVANIDMMIIVASASIPVTDPFLIDRLLVLCEMKCCEPLICINKCDLKRDEDLYRIYRNSGFYTIQTSAVTKEGIDELLRLTRGKICAITGNSGVGKSSLLNAVSPGLELEVREVSKQLGRGKHTTRHVEFYRIPNGALIADTPGFSAFDLDACGIQDKGQLQYAFREFKPYMENCLFTGCSHIREKGCAVLKAVEEGKIEKSRYNSYVRLYEEAKQIKPWEQNKNK